MHMIIRSQLRSIRQALLLLAGALTLAVGALAAVGASPAAAASLPCDIYASGGTPCVAAHSTTRALYASYDGPLYQVRRASDGSTTNISPLSAGGVANAAAQDSFCAGTTCVITEIYDQSGHGNNLTEHPRAGRPAARTTSRTRPRRRSWSAATRPTASTWPPAPGTATTAPRASRPATTRRASTRSLTARMYNGGCCFDYGNAETNNDDNGNGHMEAIYFGNIKVWGFGTGNGPWIMADMENGLFSGVKRATTPTTRPSPPVHHRHDRGRAEPVGHPGRKRAVRRPVHVLQRTRPNVSGYNPMHKEGAIILGIGGDNSKGSAGTFYEGVMTSGYPSAATENAVQASIVSAGYATGSAQRGDRAHRVRPQQLQVRGQQQRQRRQRQQGADLDLQRQHRRAELDGQQQRHAHDRRRLHGHHRRQLQQRHPDRMVALQRRRQPAMAGLDGELVNPASGKCLDDPASNTTNGTQLILYTCNGGSNQQWTLP